MVGDFGSGSDVVSVSACAKLRGSTNEGWLGGDDVEILTLLVHQHPLHQQEWIKDNQSWVVEVDGQLVVLHTSPLSFETFHLFYQEHMGIMAQMVHH